jgi:hypothetical protein
MQQVKLPYVKILVGLSAGRLGSGFDPRTNALHILIRRRLQPGIGCPCGVVLAKHLGNGLGINPLRHDQKAIRLLVMASGLLMQALLGQPAGLRRWT